MKKTTLQKNVIVEEELDGIGRNGIGNLGDWLKLMLINQDCWNPHVVVDGGEVARYINQQKKPDVLPVCSCPICDNAIDKSISSIASGILWILGKYNFSCGSIVNNLKERQLFF